MKIHFFACLVTLLIAGMVNAHAQEAEQDTQRDSGQAQLSLDDMRTFTDVFNQVRKNFVDEIDDITLLNAAIQGMINELDPYSAFFRADAFRGVNDQSLGRYGGIGVDLDIRDRRIVVTGVLETGPADLAGVREGDLITAVNGQAAKGRRLTDTIEDIRGEPGTRVILQLKRPGRNAREVSVVREYIPARSVEATLLEERFGHFKVSHFHEQSHTEFAAAIRNLEAQSDTRLQGAILDLRDNPGGVLGAAVSMADSFLEEGLIVYTQSRYPDTQLKFNAKPGEWLPGIPLVVLVNRGTASSSEVLAGALQDNGRAVVVGQKTFGKGSIQSVLTLRNGSALRLTTARYFTPSGKSIQDVGIEPDIEILNGGENQAVEQALDVLRKASAG